MWIVVWVIAVLHVLKSALNGSVHVVVRVNVAAAVGGLRNVARGYETSGKGESGGYGEELHFASLQRERLMKSVMSDEKRLLFIYLLTSSFVLNCPSRRNP